MMKCKVAIDDKNECTNCCYFCDKKDTCNQHLVDGTQVWLHYLFLWELITFQDWWLQVFFTSPTKLNQVHWKAKQDGKDFAGNA